MTQIKYEDMVRLAKTYCDLLPDLSPARKHEMEALCTPDCDFPYPGGETEAEFVSEHWEKDSRYILEYEPHPMYIHVDERQNTADCILLEEVRDPATGELIEDYFDNRSPVERMPGLGGVAILRESFAFREHNGEPKIESVFVSRVDPKNEAWRRWKDLAEPASMSEEPAASYDEMMALVKRYCELIPNLSPVRKPEMEEICTADCVFPYADGVTEAEFISKQWEGGVRFTQAYEPHPLFIHVDERLMAADCLLYEEARDRESGEVITDYYDDTSAEPMPGLDGVCYLRKSFLFKVEDDELKIANIFLGPRLASDNPRLATWRKFRRGEVSA